MSTNREKSPLVTVDWLSSHLHDPDVVILDASFFLPNQPQNAKIEFDKQHIPGARFFDIDLIADAASDLPHMLPSPGVFASEVKALGIGSQTRVVVYDANYFMASARVWWMFRCFGHNAVNVLDGGLFRWQQLGYSLAASSSAPSTKDASTHVNAEFISEWHPELVSDRAQVKAWVAAAGQVADARSPGRFQGLEAEPRAGVRSGHIPGSFNVHFRTLVDNDSHCLLPAAQLAAAFSTAGLDLDQPLIASCGTGVTACILALAVEQLGKQHVAVYDGSWTEWGSYPSE